MRRETLAFAQQKWPGDTLYQYGLCELAQRQAVFVRQDKPSDRAIKSDRAKVVMYRPPKVRPKNIIFGGRFSFGKI